MVRVIDFIESNLEVIKTLINIGQISCLAMNEYDIYNFYKSINYEKAKLKKYAIVADKFKISTKTVYRTILKMEKKITP